MMQRILEEVQLNRADGGGGIELEEMSLINKTRKRGGRERKIDLRREWKGRFKGERLRDGKNGKRVEARRREEEKL